MVNPLSQALSKVGNKLAGRSVVDNRNNPASAYSQMQRKTASKVKQKGPYHASPREGALSARMK